MRVKFQKGLRPQEVKFSEQGFALVVGCSLWKAENRDGERDICSVAVACTFLATDSAGKEQRCHGGGQQARL